MKKISLLLAGVLASAGSVPAYADIAYMTGSDNPWGISDADAGSPESAMDGAFGAGNWTKYQGFDTSVFNAANSFVYIEGGAYVGIDAFINGGGRTAIESYLTAGGSVFFNAARNDSSSPLDVAFGATITGGSFCDFNCALTGAGLAAGLDANGAGTVWSGSSFSHDVVSGLGNSLISYNGGTILADGRFGDGYLMVGGQTPPYFQNQPAAIQLRINELTYAASQATATAAVPEPATWAMFILGFALIGGTMRARKKQQTNVRFGF